MVKRWVNLPQDYTVYDSTRERINTAIHSGHPVYPELNLTTFGWRVEY